MIDLGWLCSTAKIVRGKMHYTSQILNDKKTCSPLQLLMSVVNTRGEERVNFDTKQSWLISLEGELQNINKKDRRKFQLAFAILHFDKLGNLLKEIDCQKSCKFSCEKKIAYWGNLYEKWRGWRKLLHKV